MIQKQLLNLTEVAAEIGCDKATVSRRAAELKLGTRLGRQVLVFTPSEVAKLRKVIRPRPRFRA